jgi:hypothetical protein
LPEAYRPQAPELPEWLWFVWHCWQRLRHDRPWVPRFGAAPVPGKISYRDVMLWAERHGLGDDDAELLDFGVQVLDAEYLAWWEMDQGRQAQNVR